MKFEEINWKIKNLFGISGAYTKKIYDFIIKEELLNILEIGFAHGKSTCYMAAALDEFGKGSITTLDLEIVKAMKPNLTELSKEVGLDKYIKPIYSNISGNWELRKIIMRQTKDDRCEPIYDMCFIDAFHSWEMAGFDFMLSDKLLQPGGWMLFDDLNWTFESSPSWSKSGKNKNLPEDYKATRQVHDVFTYLVRQNENYHNFSIDGTLGMAQKK